MELIYREVVLDRLQRQREFLQNTRQDEVSIHELWPTIKAVIENAPTIGSGTGLAMGCRIYQAIVLEMKEEMHYGRNTVAAGLRMAAMIIDNDLMSEYGEEWVKLKENKGLPKFEKGRRKSNDKG